MGPAGNPEQVKLETNFNIMVFCIIYGPLALFLVAAALIYSFQDIITPIVDSDRICKNDIAMDFFSWTFPKIISHCDLIGNTDLQFHESSDILIIIDIYIAVCFVYFFFSFGSILPAAQIHYPNWTEESSNLKEDPLKETILIVSALLVFGFSVYQVFFSSGLVEPEGVTWGRAVAIYSSSWGFGPMFQVLVFSFGGNFFLFIIILFVRARYFASVEPPK